MTKYRLMQEIKEQLKSWSQRMRELRNARNTANRGERKLWEIENDVRFLRNNIRLHHIAYCEARGRKRAQIEKPAKCNFPSEEIIAKIKKEWKAKLSENACVD